MLFSYQWLKTYVPEIPEPRVLKEELTRRSVEVESITPAYPYLQDVVVGEILSTEKHPNADRLTVCQVNVGENSLQIVCGGSNVRANMRVVVAKIGAKVIWHGEGEPVTLEKARLRGVESYGMICSANEIGLSALFPPKEKEVMDVSTVMCAPGTPIADALDLHDEVIDIDNKSMTHRPDLFSHIGLAREIAAVFNLKCIIPEYPQDNTLTAAETLPVRVENGEACRRYAAVELSVSFSESPEIIRRRLSLSGIKSINTIVDITNYILLEYGQPLHAFDQECVEGDIIVRNARAGESITTLDHETHELNDRILMIADSQKPLAVAGIIGGLSSAVTTKTQRIILEVAHFDAVIIRKASQAIGVRTDAVLRWEKGPSEELVTHALPAAIRLLKLYANAEVRRYVDAYPQPRVQKPVEVSVEAIQRLVGVDIPLDESVYFLQRLSCNVSVRKEMLTVIPPWFRMDLKIQEDVIEEIVRMYGVDRVPEQKLLAELHVAHVDPEVALSRALRTTAASMQFFEFYAYSFYGANTRDVFGIIQEPHVEILNPLSDDLAYLRISLLPNMLQTVVRNSAHEHSIQAFEIGHIYFADREVRQLCMVVTGDNAFRRLRGSVEELLRAVNVPFHSSVITQTAECAFWNWYEGGQALEYTAQKGIVGTIGKLSRTLATRLKLKSDCAFALLSLPQLIHDEAITQHVRIPSLFPSIPLDLSLVVPEEVSWESIERVVRAHGANLLQSIELRDVYVGAPLESGTKSFLFHLEFQAHDHTLEMSEMESWRDKFVQECATQFRATLRDNA